MKITVQSEPVSESELQKLICWLLKVNYPNLIFFSDLSGVRLGWKLAKQIKDLKYDRGIPDLWIIKRIDPYPGLVLELKTTINTPFLKDGTISKDKHVQEQVAVMRSITKEGYLVLFGVGINDSVKIIEMYMRGDIVGILELLKDKNQKYD